MNAGNSKPRHIPWVGLILILIGLVFLFENLEIINLGRIIVDWWPVILIAAGITKLRGPSKGNGVVLLVLGLLLLSITLDLINWAQLGGFWPLLLIGVGVYLVLKRQGVSLFATQTEVSDADYIHANAVFGGLEQNFTSMGLRGGEISALFGGVEINLSQARLAEHQAAINVSAMFGGVEIRVPDDWNVMVTGAPILGDIESKARSGDPNSDSPTVTFHCTVAFGGVEIKN
ncbi:MAG: Protein LiaF [Candidatus Marinimicrobia bacterium]|nr:Protein LiaF [Candidatus Neomarinimicrobiota bacterium]